MNKGYVVKGLNQRLRQAVADSNLTMTEIEKKSGVSRGMMWSYLVAGNNPSVWSLARLAETLNVSSDWLLGLKGENI